MMRAHFAAVLIVLASSVAIGQHGDHAAANSYPSTEDLVRRLESKDASVRKNVVDSLGIVDWTLSKPCYEEFDKVEVKQVALVKDRESAILIVKSYACQSLSIIPVINERDKWVAYRVITLWAKFDYPTIRIDSLVNVGEQEIIASKVLVDEGTGLYQENMTIFKFQRGKLEVVFDQPESLSVGTMIHEKDNPTRFNDIETSVFKFSKFPGGSGGMWGEMYIEETRNIMVEKESGIVGNEYHTKKSVKVYRRFDWDPQLEIFRMIEEAQP
jgi:hypothetical protein